MKSFKTWLHTKTNFANGAPCFWFLRANWTTFFVSIISNNIDLEFSHLLQLLHCLSINAFSGRWWLLEFAFSISRILDSILQYGMWNPRNQFLHLNWIVWIPWKLHFSIHRWCLCNETSIISFHEHQSYKHQP